MVAAAWGSTEQRDSAPAAVPTPLLAVRRAAWPLRRGLVRSQRISAVLEEVMAIDAELAPLSRKLVDALYASIPHATGAKGRRRLLSLKRAVFTERPIPADAELAWLDDEGLSSLRPELHGYHELLRRRGELVVANRDAAVEECRRALLDRIGAHDFRLAVAASSPTLSAGLERNGAELSPRDSRSLYAYVCRFATKANPLHLFSHFVPSPSMDGSAPPANRAAQCEVVFDVAAILELERRLLARLPGSPCVRLALRPLIRKGDRWQLWFKREEGLCAAFLPDVPLLAKLKELYDARRDCGTAPSFTRSELEQALAEGSDAGALSEAATAVDGLLARGVLVPYLIKDLFAPAAALKGLDASSETLVGCLDRWQLKRVGQSALVNLDRELAAAAVETGTGPNRLRYHVNSYAADDLEEADLAARELAAPLEDLKPLLTLEGNFSSQRRVIRQFFEEELGERRPRPYLELLTSFLRRRVDILDRFKWGRDAPDYDALVQRFRQRGGEIERAEVLELGSLLGPATGEFCCVGPFDFAQRRFFLSNIFAGDQVSVSRYLLDRRRQRSAGDASSTHLDVELAIPPENNLNLVVRRFDAGFGFDGRWAHDYRVWLEPGQVDVDLEDGRPLYLHAASGRRLRFHHRGLLQAQYLPIEYQLLLADHTANYRNPFAIDPPAASDTGIERQPALSFGPVCLRREQWCVPASLFLPLLDKADPFASAVALRRWVRERLAAEDLWFYRLPRSGGRGRKPRLLDLLSPLSIMAFRHALAAGAGHVILSRMEPGEAGLWKIEGERYVAELMVEV